MVAAGVEAEPGMRIGDFCAAPGGKSFILASRTGPKGFILAADVSMYRLLQMRKRISLYGITNCSLVCSDLEYSAPAAASLDSVLLDVPCSGLGTIRSNPDIRWLFREENLLRQQSRQAAILRNGYNALAKGRKLFYTSCSTEPEENEDVIRRFLRDETSAELVGEPFYTHADQDEGEGFFMAVIRKS
jgi:16S rRNA (cytosine967-C5)-methyltransferase